jgi:hypothetical protein
VAPAAALAGNVDIWADHAGALDCGGGAAPSAFGGPLPPAGGSFGAPNELMSSAGGLRPGFCAMEMQQLPAPCCGRASDD